MRADSAVCQPKTVGFYRFGLDWFRISGDSDLGILSAGRIFKCRALEGVSKFIDKPNKRC